MPDTKDPKLRGSIVYNEEKIIIYLIAPDSIIADIPDLTQKVLQEYESLGEQLLHGKIYGPASYITIHLPDIIWEDLDILIVRNVLFDDTIIKSMNKSNTNFYINN